MDYTDTANRACQDAPLGTYQNPHQTGLDIEHLMSIPENFQMSNAPDVVDAFEWIREQSPGIRRCVDHLVDIVKEDSQYPVRKYQRVKTALLYLVREYTLWGCIKEDNAMERKKWIKANRMSWLSKFIGIFVFYFNAWPRHTIFVLIIHSLLFDRMFQSFDPFALWCPVKCGPLTLRTVPLRPYTISHAIWQCSQYLSHCVGYFRDHCDFPPFITISTDDVDSILQTLLEPPYQGRLSILAPELRRTLRGQEGQGPGDFDSDGLSSSDSELGSDHTPDPAILAWSRSIVPAGFRTPIVLHGLGRHSTFDFKQPPSANSSDKALVSDTPVDDINRSDTEEGVLMENEHLSDVQDLEQEVVNTRPGVFSSSQDPSHTPNLRLQEMINPNSAADTTPIARLAKSKGASSDLGSSTAATSEWELEAVATSTTDVEISEGDLAGRRTTSPLHTLLPGPEHRFPGEWGSDADEDSIDVLVPTRPPKSPRSLKVPFVSCASPKSSVHATSQQDSNPKLSSGHTPPLASSNRRSRNILMSSRKPPPLQLEATRGPYPLEWKKGFESENGDEDWFDLEGLGGSTATEERFGYGALKDAPLPATPATAVMLTHMVAGYSPTNDNSYEGLEYTSA